MHDSTISACSITQHITLQSKILQPLLQVIAFEESVTTKKTKLTQKRSPMRFIV